jgi:hypothetical protein
MTKFTETELFLTLILILILNSEGRGKIPGSEQVVLNATVPAQNTYLL